uniref:Protein SPT2 homolog n=1 Tax=Parastrongyloides trichosuri TaxID=131310 RepID=A0A0N5A596_PARTI
MDQQPKSYNGSSTQLFNLQREMEKKKEEVKGTKTKSKIIVGGFSLKKRPKEVVRREKLTQQEEEDRLIVEKQQLYVKAMEEKTKKYNEMKKNHIYDEDSLIQPDYDNSFEEDEDDVEENDDIYFHEKLYRDYGPCKYTFSKDEIIKEIQQKELKDLSLQTQDARERAKKMIFKRLEISYQRIKETAKRRNIDIGNFENFVSQNTYYYSDNNKKLKEESDSDEEILKPKKRREWDEGKITI